MISIQEQYEKLGGSPDETAYRIYELVKRKLLYVLAMLDDTEELVERKVKREQELLALDARLKKEYPEFYI